MNSITVPYHLCFETFANELRIKIVQELKKKPQKVDDLVKSLKAEQSRVSHSLKMLRDCSIVDVSQKGKERIYSLKKGVEEGINSEKSTLFDFFNTHFENYCNMECKKR